MPWRSVRRPCVRQASTFSFKRLLLKNYLVNFIQTRLETCLGDRDSDLIKLRGWPLLGPNKVQNKDNFDKYSKIFFSWTTGRNTLIFGIEHRYPWGKGIQVCSNKVPRVMYGTTLGT